MGEVAALIAIEGATTALKVGGGMLSAQSQKQALRQQILEERLSATKAQVDADNRMQELNAHQINTAAASGFTYSGSFSNLTAANLDKFDQDSQIRKANSLVRISYLKSEQKNISQNAWINAFSEVGEGIGNTYFMAKGL